MKEIHLSKVLSKPRAPRGEQAAKANTVVSEYERTMKIALYGAFGVSPRCLDDCPSFQKFLQKKTTGLKDRPRTSLLEIKLNLTRCKISLIQTGSVPRELLGMVLPRRFTGKIVFKNLLQFLRLGRALPKIPKIDKDLKDQLERMTTPFSEPVHHRIMAVLSRINWPDPIIESVAGDFLSNAACLEKTRKEGGRSSLLGPANDIIEIGKSVGVTTGLMRVDESADEFADILASKKLNIDCKPLVIREIGAKVRIVTKHHSTILALSHRARRALWPLLANVKHISVSESLSDPVLSRILFPKKKGIPDLIVFSADLSAATDNLGWPAIRAVCKLARVPFEYVAPGSINGVKVCRGTAMGLPASWPILSIIHYAICCAVDGSHSFRIKGDDLIALWTRSQIEDYYLLCKNVGFIVNPKKSMESQTHGVFCEVTYVRKDNLLIRLPDFSIRSFVKGEPLSYEQWSMFVSHGADLRRLHQLSKYSLKHLLKMCTKSRIDPYMPRQLAGLGLPPKSFDTKLKARSRFILNAVHNGIPPLVEIPRRGTSTDIFTKYISENIRMTAQKPSAFSTWVYKTFVPPLLARAAFHDACHNRGRQTSFRHRDMIRNLSRLQKRILKTKGHTEFSATFRTVYDVQKKIGVVRGPELVWLGTSGFTSSSFYKDAKKIIDKNNNNLFSKIIKLDDQFNLLARLTEGKDTDASFNLLLQKRFHPIRILRRLKPRTS